MFTKHSTLPGVIISCLTGKAWLLWLTQWIATSSVKNRKPFNDPEAIPHHCIFYIGPMEDISLVYTASVVPTLRYYLGRTELSEELLQIMHAFIDTLACLLRCAQLKGLLLCLSQQHRVNDVAQSVAHSQF